MSKEVDNNALVVSNNNESQVPSKNTVSHTQFILKRFRVD